MATKELKKKAAAKRVQINPDLEKFRGKVLFPHKLAKANAILSKAPLPELSKS